MPFMSGAEIMAATFDLLAMLIRSERPKHQVWK